MTETLTVYPQIFDYYNCYVTGNFVFEEQKPLIQCGYTYEENSVYYCTSATQKGVYCYTYARNNPLMYTDPSGEWIHLVIGAIIGGVMNVAMNTKNINNAGQMFAYFGIGALAGALGAGIGAGVNSMFIAGGSFATGFLGTSTAGVATGFLAGGTSAAAGGLASGFITGASNSWMQGNNFGQGLLSGLKTGAIAGASGFVLGGITGGIAAKVQGKNFWNGSIKTTTTFVDQNITPVLQNGDMDCVGSNIESISNGQYSQGDVRNALLPGSDPNTQGMSTYDATKWYAGERGVSWEHVNLNSNPLSAEQYTSIMTQGNGNNAILSIGQGNLPGHTVTLKSIVGETIIKQSGKVVYNTIYTVMDPAVGRFVSYYNGIYLSRAVYFIGIP